MKTTRIMTSYKFGDVVLVPFPFTDQSSVKKRPAVVVSSDAYHRDRPDIIIMAITSQMRPTQTVGETPVQNWQDAGLLKPSTIKPLIATIELGLILNKLGQLKENDLAELKRSIASILG